MPLMRPRPLMTPGSLDESWATDDSDSDTRAIGESDSGSHRGSTVEFPRDYASNLCSFPRSASLALEAGGVPRVDQQPKSAEDIRKQERAGL
jgi:hypothetical protein